ncbi:heavy metal-associated domain protein [Leptospira inadai serovar Lyme str. 10]|uniref:Heavy metal-associated domain protein n=2 Tax=Leptospira inadai serovar Lyme TaxID=293084 RepID=V6H8C8_9LEPT|nr:heavy-metal-associated domain-containing protein [Leptospira inadai]EQA35146.1 heavy metal-associated domain protein [Leptospira inadai serovar Lyme str. 10]PNV74580.1 heavy metal transport/detoxification protein [Leptospira inadai serovar Lyme]
MRELKIDGMTCDHCMSTIKKAIQKMDPKAKIEIDLKTGIAKIESASTEADLSNAIREEGYTLLSIKNI